MKGTVQDEVLSCIVCKHDYGPAHIGFDLIKFEESQQVIGDYKEDYAQKSESKWIIFCLLVPLQSESDF